MHTGCFHPSSPTHLLMTNLPQDVRAPRSPCLVSPVLPNQKNPKKFPRACPVHMCTPLLIVTLSAHLDAFLNLWNTHRLAFYQHDAHPFSFSHRGLRGEGVSGSLKAHNPHPKQVPAELRSQQLSGQQIKYKQDPTAWKDCHLYRVSSQCYPEDGVQLRVHAWGLG